jgi:hypothetical protein
MKMMKVIFPEIEIKPHEIPKVRGFFANKFRDEPLLHNHLPGGTFSYKYPQIQYRIIQSHPALIAFGEGFEVLKKIFFNLDEMIIQEKIYHLQEKEISVTEEQFGQIVQAERYQFLSPWMALNEDNYAKYLPLNELEQQIMLKKIIIGNIITLAKGMNYTIPEPHKLQCEGYFRPTQIHFKKMMMQCFYGDFMVNFQIPDLLGLGKQVARGFGVVKHER